MTKRAVLFIADGTEEIEAIAPFDILKRSGVEVTIAALPGQPLETRLSHGLPATADAAFEDAGWETADALILPGGRRGTDNFKACKLLHEALRAAASRGALVCAICAAPEALGVAGLLAGKKYTCYPGCEEAIADGERLDEVVVKDGNLLTSQGPGTALAFGFAIAAELAGPEASARTARGMLVER
jgi:4-methyl-5(b-hydroxyethyl)-thiazole monophosphate biosynthesis